MQRSALCRSRRELSNEYLLAKIGVDTAENEPLEVWGKIIQYYSFVSLATSHQTVEGSFSAGWLAGKPDYPQKLKVPEGYEKINENRNI